MAKVKPTTKICKHCAMEIPYNAKVCPNCRKKQGMGCLPIVLIVLGVFILIGIVTPKGGDSDSGAKETKSAKTTTQSEKKEKETEAETEPIEYTSVTVNEMMQDLKDNAMKAQDKYKDQYLEVTGRMDVIDSSGKYISLYPDEIAITGVKCNLKNDTQKAQAANMAKGDMVTLRGKCKDVGEVMGYTLDVDSIDGYSEEAAGIDVATDEEGYITVTAGELEEIIEANAMQAQNTFKGKQVAVTGKLGNIDSNGSYISIDSDNEWSFVNIQCYLKSDDQKAKIMDLKKGDTLTVKGKCKDVGELLGYQIDIESIE